MSLRTWVWILPIISCLPVLGAESPASPPPVTLEQSVEIETSIDRGEVYLGEAVNLTLEYRELVVRGLKVQPLYRSGNIEPPSLEGFYAGPLETQKDNVVRDGALYAVLRHRQRIYPAVAGELTIGPWRWQGTVRGHTAAGSASSELDLRTATITVRVLPLPTPPSTFRGAVGEFSITQSVTDPALTQGSPVSLLVTITGSGNPGALEAPLVPEGTWFSADDPKDHGQPAPDSATGQFSRQFSYALMPLIPGNFQIPSLSLTYFSPSDRRYKSARTSPIAVTVKASGPAESLVVVGGSTSALGEPERTAEGRLALARGDIALDGGRRLSLFWALLVALPPLAWLLQMLRGEGWRTLRHGPWQWRGHLHTQFQALPSHPQPAEALNGLLNAALVRALGTGAPGLAPGALRGALEERLGPEEVGVITRAVEVCRDHRYGKEALTPATLEGALVGLPDALTALIATANRKGPPA